jgi:PAS domain S-box-containing protein
MKTKIEQFPATNPNPVLSVAVDGTVLYSNTAGEPLLHEWCATVGEKLPPYLIDVVNGVTSINAPQKIEVKSENRVYSVLFHPLPEEEYVNIYGFDISDQKDEIQSLKARLEEPEELQRAIREGDVDALVMPVSEEDLMVFTLNGADQAYRILMETANEDVVIVEDKFKVTYAGKRLLDKIGYIKEEMLGRPLMQFIDREYKTFVEQRMEDRRKGISDNYEVKLIRRDGSPYWVTISAKPIFANDGRFKGALGMLTDITEHKKAEEALHVAYENLQVRSEELQVQSEEINVQNEELQTQSEELNEAYETLRKSEARFRSVLDNSHDVIYRLNVQTGRYEYISPSAYEGTGFTPDEFMVIDAETGLSMIHPDDLPSMQEGLERLKVTGKSNVEYRQRTKSGEYRWLSNHMSLTMDSAGRPLYRNGNIRDITERKQAEEALRESEKLLQTVLDNSRDGINMLDLATGRYVFMSPAQVEITGFTAEEINNISAEEAYERVHPDDREISVSQQKLLTSGVDTSKSVEYRWKIKSGEYRWFSDSRKLVRDSSGKPVALVGVSRDITEHKQAEKELRQSEDQFRALVKNVKSGIALVDENGRFTVVNPSFMQIFGLDNELDILNVNSQDWSQWEVYGEDGRLLHVDDHPVRKAAMTCKPVKDQLIAVRNPGAIELIWMLISAEPVLKEDSQIYRVICTYHDITERRQMEEALKKAHDSLEEKVKERTSELERT